MAESNGRRNEYEAMFLVSQASAADLGGVVDHVQGLLDRAGAEVIAMRKWDERRLAYEIDKQKRGTFLLVYFEAETSRLAGLERDCNLSDVLLRTMVTRADHLTREEMQAADARDELKTEIELRQSKAEAERAESEAGAGAG